MSNSVNILTINLSSLGADTPKSNIVTFLREGPLQITFTKRDGTERVMNCTLQADVVVPYEKKTDRVKVPNDNVLPVWDLEAGAWRSITVDSITAINLIVVGSPT